VKINKHKVRRMLKSMVEKQIIFVTGINRWVKYSIEQNVQEND